jgi:rRNA pseudouridine-1189 N-methylase Emg1 (Nep1/Mra1 family)
MAFKYKCSDLYTDVVNVLEDNLIALIRENQGHAFCSDQMANDWYINSTTDKDTLVVVGDLPNGEFRFRVDCIEALITLNHELDNVIK